MEDPRLLVTRVYSIGYKPGKGSVLQTEHFRRWLDGLADGPSQRRIAARIIALQAGHLGDWRSVDRDVSELRLHFGPGYRVYFTRRRRSLFVLLAGGDKQSQRRDIEVARWLARNIDVRKDTDP